MAELEIIEENTHLPQLSSDRTNFKETPLRMRTTECTMVVPRSRLDMRTLWGCLRKYHCGVGAYAALARLLPRATGGRRARRSRRLAPPRADLFF
jgi:hypothetical protein